MSRPPTSPLVSLAALCAAAAASLLLVACGGSSSTNAASAEQEQQAETKLANFARCMREHGINAEIATPPGGGHALKVSPRQGGPHGPQQFEAAERACARYRPEPKAVNLSPQQKVELEEKLQRFARCMREHGIKVETSTKGGDVQVGIHVRAGEAGAPNPESPAFQAAQNACHGLLPGPKGAPGPLGSRTDGPNTGVAHGRAGSGIALAGGAGP